MGTEDASTLMEHLPPVGWADVATKRDLEMLRLEWRADLANGLRVQAMAIIGAMAALNAAAIAIAKLIG
jgi:hypothetical protein